MNCEKEVGNEVGPGAAPMRMCTLKEAARPFRIHPKRGGRLQMGKAKREF